MKRLTFLASLLFCVALVWAQDTKPNAPATPAASENVSGPIMTLDSDVVDYGDIEHGSDPLRSVGFKNTGTEPLLITNAKGSCGCTVPEWPRDPIMPGETSEIKVRYDTKRPGAINKTIKITTNETENTHTIRVIGHIAAQAPEPDALPKKEGLFGSNND